MSQHKRTSWWSATTSAVVGGIVLLVVPGLAQWIFPDWGAFFAFGSKWLGVVWSWLTAEWTLPAVPLVVAGVLAVWFAFRSAPRSHRSDAGVWPEPAPREDSVDLKVMGQTISLVPQHPGVPPSPDFNASEIDILRRLLHSDTAWVTAQAVAMQSEHPKIVLEVAAKSLAQRQLIEINGGIPKSYKLTPQGSTLVIGLWNAAKRV